MGKKRTALLFLLSTLLMQVSCKLYQQQDREEQYLIKGLWKHNEQANLLYNLRRDSFSRYWYFSSDSSFRFHPDSGLIGKGGELLMQQSGVKTSLRNSISTTVNDTSLKTAQKSKSDRRSRLSIPQLWLIGFIAVLLFGWWKLRWLVKRFLQ
ncbi:hypothetical protein BCY89_00110 [Sphingobacterium siyangense]|uniref:Uncharacterized protein n=1 Tax=Sphingobacterium siyangense TaxID=459529 RepID=A0A420G9X5_9SPHI|nr:hypothetical protein [Sphingobacterium siyangense]RKF41956.1 hypothetical protein BCY89_00110 [Sphingobacterium siyangense]